MIENTQHPAYSAPLIMEPRHLNIAIRFRDVAAFNFQNPEPELILYYRSLNCPGTIRSYQVLFCRPSTSRQNNFLDCMRPLPLHSVLVMHAGARKPDRQMEIPTKTQAEVLSASGHYVDASGVLQAVAG